MLPIEPGKRAGDTEHAPAMSKAPRFLTTLNGKLVAINDPDRVVQPKPFAVQRVKRFEMDKEEEEEGVLAAQLSDDSELNGEGEKSVVVNDPDRPFQPKPFVDQRTSKRCEMDKEEEEEGVLAAQLSDDSELICEGEKLILQLPVELARSLDIREALEAFVRAPQFNDDTSGIQQSVVGETFFEVFDILLPPVLLLNTQRDEFFRGDHVLPSSDAEFVSICLAASQHVRKYQYEEHASVLENWRGLCGWCPVDLHAPSAPTPTTAGLCLFLILVFSSLSDVDESQGEGDIWDAVLGVVTRLLDEADEADDEDGDSDDAP